MTALPKRRKPMRSGILRGPRRVWPKHERWVRGYDCSIIGCQDSPIEFAHLRTAANSGTGLKPGSWEGISLCRIHHSRGHLIGHDAMARENGMTLEQLHAIAAEFTRRSPDKWMHLSLRLYGHQPGNEKSLAEVS